MSSIYGSSSWGRRTESTGFSNQCYHRLFCGPRMVKNGSNTGRQFYGCALWPKEDCHYFQWVDEGNRPCKEDNRNDKEMLLEHLFSNRNEGQKALEEKIVRLKLKKKMVEAKNQEMQLLITKNLKS
ncbi:unnamed protein product, partial [Cuscuta europaea]